MLAKPLPPLDYLRECFDYDAETGVLRRRRTGRACGYLNPKDGYLRIGIYVDRAPRTLLAHRVAWVIYHGAAIPDGAQIDHVNGDRGDNRIVNLRLASAADNTRNSARAKRNNRSSGIRGVYANWGGKWIARVGVNQRGRRACMNLGTFNTKEQALAARIAWEREHYGDFAPQRGEQS